MPPPPRYSGLPAVHNAPGDGKRAQNRAAAAAKGQVNKAPRGGGKGAAPAPPKQANGVNVNAQRADGRYLYSLEGLEICFAYSRSANGCTATCKGQPQRAHLCEWCRGSHRSIECPTHPGWQPPPAQGQGGGKGK